MTDEFKVFANAGDMDTDTVLDTYVDNGFVAERLRYKAFNRLVNRLDYAINEMLRGGLKGLTEEGSDLNHVTRLYPPDVSSVSMDDDVNILRAETVGEEYGVDMCYFVANGIKYLVALEQQGLTVDVFNLTTKTRVQYDLSSTLPATAGAWRPVSVCTDNTHAYVLFNDDDTPANRRLHAYLLTDWTAHTGWASSVDCGSSTSANDGNVILCADGKLAVNCAWFDMTLNPIRIFSAAGGSSLTTGNGDSTLGVNGYARSSITSDGEYVYFAVDNTAGGSDQLCSASITNALVGCGGSGWPGILPGTLSTDILAAGGVVVSLTNDIISIASPLLLGGSELIDDGTIMDKRRGLGFDGSSFWVIGEDDSEGLPFVAKIEILRGIQEGVTKTLTVPFQQWKISSVVDILPNATKLWFDGCDFWFASNNGTGHSGIFRFPKPLVR